MKSGVSLSEGSGDGEAEESTTVTRRLMAIFMYSKVCGPFFVSRRSLWPWAQSGP